MSQKVRDLELILRSNDDQLLGIEIAYSNVVAWGATETGAVGNIYLNALSRTALRIFQ